MDEPKFLLLKLPYLAIALVLETMDFVQLFHLAQVSKRMRRIVRISVHIRNHTLDLALHKKNVFLFMRDDQIVSEIEVLDAAFTPPEDECFFQQIGQFEVAHSEYENYPSPYLMTYWMNVLDGLKELYREISQIFRMPLNQFIISIEGIKYNHEKFIPWLNTLAPRISRIQLLGETCNYRRYLYSIRDINFGLYAPPVDNFVRRYSILNFDRVYIRPGQFIRVNQILSMEARQITIHNVKFLAKDYDTLFGSLKNGAMPNLVELRIGSNPPTLQENTLLRFEAKQTNEHTFEVPLNNRKCVLGFAIDSDEEWFWNFFKMENINEDQS